MWTMLYNGPVEFRGEVGRQGCRREVPPQHGLLAWNGRIPRHVCLHKCSGAGPPGRLCVLYDGGGVHFPKRQSSKYVQQQYTLQGGR